jgi:integrase
MHRSWLTAAVRACAISSRSERFRTAGSDAFWSSAANRSVPLATRVAVELRAHRERSTLVEPDDLVFCHPTLGRPLERSRLFKRLKAVGVAAGFPALGFHDLRHTFGTRMAAAGIPLRTLQEWMGHVDFKTTLVYADYQPRDDEVSPVDRAFED